MGAPGAHIVFLKVPCLQYEQILLTKDFRQYLETISQRSYEKTLYEKTYKIQASSQEFTVSLKGCNRQFDWLEVSLVYDKSDKHLTNDNSYNAECAAKKTKY